MKRPHSLLLLLTALLLASCASTTALKITPTQEGERVTIPKHHLSVTLTPGWRIAKTAPANTLLFASAANGNLRFVIVGPLGDNSGPKDALVANAAYQKGIQQTLADGGFSKVDRAGMFRVAGVSAFRCDASTRNKSQSIMQVHVPYNNRVWVLSFYSTGEQVSRFTAVPKILQSLQFLP
jgi:hypothetical protein|uniref:hypothetical protein n=1 Tax=Prosthecobacter sp. TaxID=1965333 RepID=UPI0037832755